MIKVSIIIVNYNTKELLDNCIESVYEKCTSKNFEIIVVDNNSFDDSCNMITEKYKNVILIKNKVNYGFGKANNIGVKVAKGEFVLFLNSDTIVQSNIVDEFIKYYEDNELKGNIGCLGAWLFDNENNVVSSAGSFPNGKRIIKEYINIIRKSNKNNNVDRNKNTSLSITDVDYVVGALMFLKRDLFISLGGFDEKFFMYFEETDLQFRLKEVGLRRVLITEPKVIHLEGKSPNRSNTKRIIYTQSMYTYFKKRYVNIKYYVFKILTLFLRLPAFLRREYSFKENISFFYNVIRG